MSKVIIKDIEKFENIVNELEQTIPDFEDIFYKQNNNFALIDGTDNYKGKCQEVISEKYNKFKNNYQYIDEALINYVKYLKITIANYKNYINRLNQGIDDNQENLRVN